MFENYIDVYARCNLLGHILTIGNQQPSSEQEKVHRLGISRRYKRTETGVKSVLER